jgi:hypothetical protein
LGACQYVVFIVGIGCIHAKFGLGGVTVGTLEFRSVVIR